MVLFRHYSNPHNDFKVADLGEKYKTKSLLLALHAYFFCVSLIKIYLKFVEKTIEKYENKVFLELKREINR
jgi:hypothetical protein